MFPSDSNGNNNDPIAYIDHSTIFHSNNIINQFSKQEDLPFSVFHLPSPYYNNHCDDQFELFGEFEGNLSQQQHTDLLLPQQNLTADNSVSDTIINMPDSDKSQTNGSNANEHHRQKMSLWMKSNSKKDRHSKIITAKGPRDRRMRLSLAVAKEFFSLQDMLGYDKASKTVEWLLIQAKTEIKKLSRSSNNKTVVAGAAAAAKSPSETSEGEVVSGIDMHKVVAMEGKGKCCIKEKKVIRKARKPAFRPLARDLREQARARAKARTKAKNMWTQRLDDQSKNDVMNKFGFWSNYFDKGEEPYLHNNHGDSNNIGDDSLPILKKWGPNSMFNCLQNTQEQHHHLIGFLPFGKPWDEGYNNQNM